MLPAEKDSNELLFSLLPGLDKHISIEDYQLQKRAMQDAAWPHVSLLPGAYKLIRHLHSHGIPMAVATGSMKRNYLFKVAHEQCAEEKVEIFRLFGDNVICGDDPRVLRPKPAPDIFLTAAAMLGKDVGLSEGLNGDGVVTEAEKNERSKCLVFEDGIPGVQAAQRAGMQGQFQAWC
jgi:pseudouridine-5'-monophosphatase